MTHCDITMDNDIGKDIQSDVKMNNNVNLCIDHHITMHNGIGMSPAPSLTGKRGTHPCSPGKTRTFQFKMTSFSQ